MDVVSTQNPGSLLGFTILMWLLFALVFFGLPAAYLAGQRGRSPIVWAIVAVFIGPLAIVTVGFSTRVSDGRFRACPHCDEAISRSAGRCPYCTSELTTNPTEVNPYLRLDSAGGS